MDSNDTDNDFEITKELLSGRLTKVDQCWICTKEPCANGRVMLSICGIVSTPRSFVYRLFNPQLEKNSPKTVVTCGNEDCVNPQHIVDLAVAKERGCLHTSITPERKKLYEGFFRDLVASNINPQVLGKQRGLSRSLVTALVRRRVFKEISEPWAKQLEEVVRDWEAGARSEGLERKRLTSAQRAEVKAICETGELSQSQVAKIWHIDPMTVSRIVHEA